MKFLVVVDAQNDFIDGALRNEEAIKAVPRIVEKIKNWDGAVIATQDTHESNYLDTREGKYLPVEHCIKGTDGWLVQNDIWKVIIQNQEGYTFIDKPTFGSFELIEQLREIHEMFEAIDEIEFCGFCTDICLISCLLIVKAAFPEVNIKVDASCCAGVTPKKHAAALEVMKSCQIEVVGE